MNTYAEEIHKQEQLYTSTKLSLLILDSKYEKADLNKFIKNQDQHLTEVQRNKFLILLQKPEELFDGTLDLFHPKMSHTLSFYDMYQKPFIYRRNRTNYK